MDTIWEDDLPIQGTPKFSILGLYLPPPPPPTHKVYISSTAATIIILLHTNLILINKYYRKLTAAAKSALCPTPSTTFTCTAPAFRMVSTLETLPAAAACINSSELTFNYTQDKNKCLTTVFFLHNIMLAKNTRFVIVECNACLCFKWYTSSPITFSF